MRFLMRVKCIPNTLNYMILLKHIVGYMHFVGATNMQSFIHYHPVEPPPFPPKPLSVPIFTPAAPTIDEVIEDI